MEIADAGSGALDALPATTAVQTKRGSFQVGQGMAVVGSDGQRVGELREVRPVEADILVHRPLLQRDVYIPCDAIDGVRDGAIVLTLPADEVAQQGWPHPPLLTLPDA